MPPVRGSVVAALLAVRVADTGYALLAKWVINENALGAALVFGLYRNAGALPFMFVIGAAQDGCVAPARRDLPHLALLCFTAVFASQACYLIGLKECNRCACSAARGRVSAVSDTRALRSLILATALGNLTPIVSSVLGWGLGRESMGAAKVRVLRKGRAPRDLARSRLACRSCWA